jgi:hydroxyethylthiazole kinase
MLNLISEVISDIRAKTPLVQAITNYVTINDCANILLCIGASPAMCEAREEVVEFVDLISALYINIGTLTKEQEEASYLAV